MHHQWLFHVYVIPVNIKNLLFSLYISHVCNMWFYNLLFSCCYPMHTCCFYNMVSHNITGLGYKLLYGIYEYSFGKISTYLPILLIDLLLNNLLIRNWYLVLTCISLSTDTEYFFIYSCCFFLFHILLVLSPVIYRCSSFLYWFIISLC